jgi:hypothetical protein
MKILDPQEILLEGRCYVSYKASGQRTISSIRFELHPHPDISWMPNRLPFWHLQTIAPFHTVALAVISGRSPGRLVWWRLALR